MHVYHNCYKNKHFYFSSLIYKNELDFTKIKKIFDIDDIDVNKILVSKKNHMAKIIHLYTLLDIMIMMLLGHYV